MILFRICFSLWAYVKRFFDKHLNIRYCSRLSIYQGQINNGVVDDGVAPANTKKWINFLGHNPIKSLTDLKKSIYQLTIGKLLPTMHTYFRNFILAKHSLTIRSVSGSNV